MKNRQLKSWVIVTLEIICLISMIFMLAQVSPVITIIAIVLGSASDLLLLVGMNKDNDNE